jgi:hypothetical protein
VLTPREFASFNDLVGSEVMAGVKMGIVICCVVKLHFIVAEGVPILFWNMNQYGKIASCVQVV